MLINLSCGMKISCEMGGAKNIKLKFNFIFPLFLSQFAQITSLRNLNNSLSSYVIKWILSYMSWIQFNEFMSQQKEQKHKSEINLQPISLPFISLDIASCCSRFFWSFRVKCNNSYLKNLLDCYQLHTSTAIL